MFDFSQGVSAIDRITKRNRKYWKLQEVLPNYKFLIVPTDVFFYINDCAWTSYIGFVDMDAFRKFNDYRSSEWFEIVVKDVNSEGEFDFRVGIVRRSGKEIVVSNAVVISPEKKYAVIRLIHRSELHNVMRRYKELELFVEIEKKDEDKNTFYMQMQKFRTDYKELLLSGRNSDFTINVKPMKFEVHKLILGARSPVFSAMMEHDMEEKRSGEVSIADSEPEIFREFLLYLYTGDEEHLDWKNIVELYELADKYCVEDLKYLCVVRMKTYISIENFVQVFYISQQLNILELTESVIQFFLEDSKEIVASEKYNEFMKEHPEETSVLKKALVADK